jgi:ribosome-binding factor A
MENSKRRGRRLADQVKYELGWIIELKLKDPKIGFLTLTRVKMSSDLRLATVYFSVLGESDQREHAVEAMNRAKKFLRRELGNRLNTRFLPELRFHFDDSLEYSAHINKILNKIHGKGDN